MLINSPETAAKQPMEGPDPEADGPEPLTPWQRVRADLGARLAKTRATVAYLFLKCSSGYAED